MTELREAVHPPLRGDWIGWCCPCCAAALQVREHGLWCDAEHRFFATIDGVHRLLPEERRREVLPLVELERRIRKDAGPRSAADVQRDEATLRRALALAAGALGARSWRVLQVGARSTSLGAWLRERGHSVALVGLDTSALSQPLPVWLPRAEADIEALPVEPGHVDLVVADDAIHRSGRLTRTLVELRRVTRRGGVLLVTGSPLYHRRADAEAAKERRMTALAARYHLSIPREQQPIDLVRSELQEAFDAAGWSLEIHPSGESRVAAWLSRLRPRPSPASVILVGRRAG